MTTYNLGPLEQEIMDCIWRDEEVSVRDVHTCLKNSRKIAYTTVMTIMTRLTDKGFLKRKIKGKAFLYSPKKTKEQTAKTMIGKIVDSLVDQFGEEAVVAFSDELEHKKRKKL
jgi:predicted transcriptional regulator